VHVAVNRRDERVFEVVSMRVDHCGRITEAIARHKNVVDLFIRIEPVASLGRVRHWRSRTKTARRRQALLARPQNKFERQAPPADVPNTPIFFAGVSLSADL
jgi:hypothetical protein